MISCELQGQLTQDQETIAGLQAQLREAMDELQQTNSELMQMTLELDDRVARRTEELRASHAELQRTNSELMQLTLDLEDRVAARTADLARSNEALKMEIAQRKRAEEEVWRLNEDLERRVVERTAQLEAVNKELEAFAYSVSHDLRAPLRGMDGFSQLLLEDYGDKLDAQGHDCIGRVRAATQRMGRLIDDLLALSRLSRQQMEFEQVDLSALARAVTARLREERRDHPVEVVIQEGMSARGDAHLLAVALENLLGNAWKFTGKRERARIEVGVAAIADSGEPAPEAHSEIRNPKSEIAFFVRDNGAGFDMAYADKLFTPFQRLHTTEEFPGTGIGLATVQRIIARHGGRIWAEGKVNEGATFFFTLL